MRPLLIALALCAAAPSVGVAQARSVWSPEARATHDRASGEYLRWIRARHDLSRTREQRRCFDRVATRTGATLRELEHRAAVGRIPAANLRDIHARLDALRTTAREVCLLTRDEDGEVEVDFRRSPWISWMRRDRLVLRVGPRYELAPRVQRGGYAGGHTLPSEVALGGFFLEWLRVEAFVSFGWQPVYGPHGSLGIRAIATTSNAILRFGAGLGASVMLASDSIGAGNFGWVGFQIEVPIELGFELSDTVGLTLIGGPLYTQAGEVRPDPRALGLSGGLLFEVAL